MVSLGSKQGRMAVATFWPGGGCGACILSCLMREWLLVLSCINALGSSNPNFYISKGRSFRHNFIIRCKEGACMAIPKKAWMTGELFNKQINHFKLHVVNYMAF